MDVHLRTRSTIVFFVPLFMWNATLIAMKKCLELNKYGHPDSELLDQLDQEA